MVVISTWGGQGGAGDADGIIGVAVPVAPVDVAVVVATEELNHDSETKTHIVYMYLFYFICIVKAIISTAVKRKKNLKQFC